ncbi:hypothetical protein WICPIJ_005508 [Wickerhamomyces pijperi]|uniref:Uncharacterized protein n=1 Tax=Wickerhamomyces pijperi TaxID=599730 RepID=A0A9P8Q3W5_WICPI|nr:hypothetical protein WICPIJ_005508 [Wickerhamomyces pijperi]
MISLSFNLLILSSNCKEASHEADDLRPIKMTCCKPSNLPCQLVGKVPIKQETVSSESKSILDKNFVKMEINSMYSCSFVVFREATVDQNSCGKSINFSASSSETMAFKVIKICMEKP